MAFEDLLTSEISHQFSENMELDRGKDGKPSNYRRTLRQEMLHRKWTCATDSIHQGIELAICGAMQTVLVVKGMVTHRYSIGYQVLQCERDYEGRFFSRKSPTP